MNRIISIPLTAIIIATIFIASCTSDNSIGDKQSYDYCITANNTCLAGPFTADACNGQASNSCPYGGGSSSGSVSIVPSSNSSVPLSSSIVFISSSEMFGSSSSYVFYSSSSIGSNVGEEFCTGYCLWPDGGCWRIATDPTGQYGGITSTCTEAITNCRANGQMFNDPDCGSVMPSSASGNAVSELCTGYCLWSDGGCWRIATDPTGQYGGVFLTCAEAIANCRANGQMFNDSSCGSVMPSSASGNAVEEPCTGYCLWSDGSCWRIATDPTGKYGDVIPTCALAIANCQTNGRMFLNEGCSGTAVTPSNSSSSFASQSSASKSSASQSSASQISYGSLTYQGQTYKTVKIGTQTWMAENLNYNASGSVCYNNQASNCTTYGRLYSHETAQTVCPSGWHLPSGVEWDMLMTAIGGGLTAGTKLKAKSGWNWNEKDNISGNGTDNYGFSALPGGRGYGNGTSFSDVGIEGVWWISDQHGQRMYYDKEYANQFFVFTMDGSIKQLYSVRCVKD